MVTKDEERNLANDRDLANICGRMIPVLNVRESIREIA